MNILQKMSKKTKIFIILALILSGIFIKCYYISYTESWERQHDVISFGADEGQAAYIEYLLNNRHLPDFDPREKWGFFQPPLHHIVSAFTIYVSEKLGASEHRAQENTQVVTCFYMIVLLILSAFIFVKAKGTDRVFSKSGRQKLETEGGIVFLAIVALHPLYTLLAGSINNDSLSLLLALISVIIAVKWFDNPGFFTTVILAVTIGLAMAAKLTGGLVAVPVGILMIMRFFGFDNRYISSGNSKITISDRLRLFFGKYFAKSLVFAVIVVPLGLGFQIYNKVRWGVPVNYIPGVGEQFDASLTVADRIFDIKPGLSKVYTLMIKRGDSFDEYNLPLAVIKTSLFGEYSFEDVSRWMKPLTLILFISALLLMVYALFATFVMTFSGKSRLSAKWKVALFGTYITYLVSYVLFAVKYSNFSAQDFRYAAICVVCEGIFAGLYTDSLKNKKVKSAVIIVALLFAASAFLTYALLGYKS